MRDDQQLDETLSSHSIGVVENPLYAEDEGTFEPSFAALSAKEKAAEVSDLSCSIEKIYCAFWFTCRLSMDIMVEK